MWYYLTSSIFLETPRELGGYGFDTLGIGYIYFTRIVSVALGALFGHFANGLGRRTICEETSWHHEARNTSSNRVPRSIPYDSWLGSHRAGARAFAALLGYQDGECTWLVP